ncbi:hypothetical protein H6F95_16035 [Cyanobacteria bacterium FACHB-471]|nr:hypothetical protein [Cyanobacteria bacterium FACHB-471]
MINLVQNTCQCSDRFSILRLSWVSAIAFSVALLRTTISQVVDSDLVGKLELSCNLYHV